MQGAFFINGRPALVRVRIAIGGLPAAATVQITDVMLQPGDLVSGWIPHVTELPWSAGIVGGP